MINNKVGNVVPFLFGFFEEVRIQECSIHSSTTTQYTTSSAGRESQYDDDP